MDLKSLDQILAGQPAFRAKQIKKDVFQRLITDWDQATSLPLSLREKLKEAWPLAINAKVLKSKDQKTVKALITLSDGLGIEAVLMRYPARNSVCVSTQVGCPVGCAFCATGKMGFKRNLAADEMVTQVVFLARFLKPFAETVSRVVFMGMGEPFLNFENTIAAVKILNDQQGLAIGARKISVSTVGLPNKIKDFADLDLQTNLALSLHAPTDELRARLIPAHSQTSLKVIFEAVDYYSEKTNRKVMIEYVMLAGVNDQPEHALQLTKLLGKRLCMVNLIRYNPTGSFQPSPQETIEEFRKILEEHNIEVTQRYSFGTDIKAACGQLATSSIEEKSEGQIDLI